LLRREQERISTSLVDIACKLDAATLRYEDVQSNLRTALDLAEDCGRAYRAAPDHVRKQFNQVFFKRVLVHDDADPEVELAPPFDTLLRAEVRTAVRRQEAENAKKPTPESGLLAKSGLNRRARPKMASLLAHGSAKTLLVEPRGIEPLTSWLPAMRSPS
jgi:hypothetical protein